MRHVKIPSSSTPQAYLMSLPGAPISKINYHLIRKHALRMRAFSREFFNFVALRGNSVVSSMSRRKSIQMGQFVRQIFRSKFRVAYVIRKRKLKSFSFREQSPLFAEPLDRCINFPFEINTGSFGRRRKRPVASLQSRCRRATPAHKAVESAARACTDGNRSVRKKKRSEEACTRKRKLRGASALRRATPSTPTPTRGSASWSLCCTEQQRRRPD